jgi:hypothetical protein
MGNPLVRFCEGLGYNRGVSSTVDPFLLDYIGEFGYGCGMVPGFRFSVRAGIGCDHSSDDCEI